MQTDRSLCWVHMISCKKGCAPAPFSVPKTCTKNKAKQQTFFNDVFFNLLILKLLTITRKHISEDAQEMPQSRSTVFTSTTRRKQN